ncbi:MAG: hypothetical protein Fur0022_22080 [Anaerolineales bacterium]
MQAFYNQLVSQTETKTLYQRWLACLMQAEIPQLTLLKSNLAWYQWAEGNL